MSEAEQLRRMFWVDDRNRIDRIRVPAGEAGYRLLDGMFILSVENEYWSGVATFQRKNGVYRCTRADTKLGWVKGIPFDALKLELLRRGCRWKWLKVKA